MNGNVQCACGLLDLISSGFGDLKKEYHFVGKHFVRTFLKPSICIQSLYMIFLLHRICIKIANLDHRLKEKLRILSYFHEIFSLFLASEVPIF